MELIFLFSALIGGTFLACQFVMTLLGLSDGDHHVDVADDLDGGDAPGDAHHSSWLFGILSFRTLIAALTFFGMSGMFMVRSGADLRDQLVVATMSGVGALFGVHALMRSFHQLNQNSTLRLGTAVGRVGTVKVSIPPLRAGPGKVQLEVQGRLEEVAAVTAHDNPLRMGTQVQVVGLQQGNLLEVMPIDVVAPV